MGDLLGYARVSTLEQNARLQTDALKSAGCYKVFTDTASGAIDERRELGRLFDQVALATPWSSGALTASAVRSATSSTPSTPSPTARSGSGA